MKRRKHNSKILQSNCSEMVFKLTGTIKEIKKELLKMVDAIEDDNGRMLPNLRKDISLITSLQDVESIVINTTNYETYFKEEKGELLVATCNNIEWSEFLDDVYEIDKSYYDIVKKRYCNITYIDDDYVVLKDSYDIGGKDPYIILKNNKFLEKIGISPEDLKNSKMIDINLVQRSKGIYALEPFGDNHQLIEVKEAFVNDNLKLKMKLISNLKGGIDWQNGKDKNKEKEDSE